MTREEAIEVIKAYRDKLTNSASNQLDGDIEACNMAIKALEQEPITDRIEYGTDGNAYRLTISNGKEFKQEQKILETLDFAIDASNGDTNYFVGFRNGLRYAKSLIDGEEEPPFESCVKQEPILDKIRAEVEALNQDYYCAGDFNKCKDYVLDILDEYRNSRKESEVTE